MERCIIFFVCIAMVLSGPVIHEDEYQKIFLYEDESGKNSTVELTNIAASPTDVTYYFCSKNNHYGVQIHSNNIAPLKDTAFNAEKDTLFIIHGWLDSHSALVNTELKESIFKSRDINVFSVDWSPVAKRTYLLAKGAVSQVGSFVGAFIQSLESTYHLNLDKVIIVGHSLGAHIAGRAGATLQGQVNRIVGLDPAGPFFSINDRNNRLDSSDAKFVEVIHTCSAKLGFKEPLGHADYYPNGGAMQAGCGVDLFGTCSHIRSFKLFAESLNSNGFVARQCDSFEDFKGGKCSNGRRAVMGQFYPDSARGTFYLETNGNSPFAKG